MKHLTVLAILLLPLCIAAADTAPVDTTPTDTAPVDTAPAPTAKPAPQTPILISANSALWFLMGHEDEDQSVSVYYKEPNEDFRRIGESFTGPVLAASVFPTTDGKFEKSLHLFFPGTINNHQILSLNGAMNPQRNYPGELRAVFQQFLLSDQSYEYVKGQWTPSNYAFSDAAADASANIPLAGTSLHTLPTADGKGFVLSLSPEDDGLKISRDNAPMVFASIPSVATCGNELAIVYRDGETWTLLMASPISGAILSEARIKTSTLDDSLRGVLGIYNDFFFVIMICLFIVMFGFKPRKITRMAVSAGPFRIAAVWKRLVALGIDYIPCSMIMSISFVPQDKMELLQKQFQAGAEPEELVATIAPEGIYALIASLALLLVVSTICEWKWGQTLGKRVMGIRVAADGSLKLNAREVLLRNLMKILEFSAMLTSALWLRLLLIAPPIFTPLHQRLGDMAARTVVIDLRIPPKPVAVAPAGEQG